MLLLILAALDWRSESPRERTTGTFANLQNLVTTPFVVSREVLFDRYQRAHPRQRVSQPVTIVEIDEKSLRAVGQWPWPRNRLADLINAIATHQPAAIGLDMYLPEPDQTSPDRVAANLPSTQAALARKLSRLPSHEIRLAAALRAAPTVLGAAGFDFATFTTSSGLRTAPVAVRGEDPLPHLRHFSHVLASLPELQAAAHGQGLLSVAANEVIIRRIPLIMSVGEQIVPGLPLELLRVASGASAIEVVTDRTGVRQASVAELAIPTQSGGDLWLHFARRANAPSRQVSAADVLAGTVTDDQLTGKLVLIGLTGLGLSDMRVTPLLEQVPGIELQAQLIESLLDGRFLLRPDGLKIFETVLLLSIGLLMIWLIPRRSGSVTETRVSRHVATTGGVTALSGLILASGFILFQTHGLLFDAAALPIAFFALLGSLVTSAALEAERNNALLAAERQQLREKDARISGELAAARRIQIGSLPDAQRLFGSERRFAIHPFIEPARDVGGDLYDFFMLDAHRLCFVIGDVSGKGVPASLFMAVTRALAKSFALRLDTHPARIVDIANAELSRDNPEFLFVTLLLGVLDVDTGQLEWVNAGHDAPWRLQAGRLLEQLTPPASAGGPPLCAIDDFHYGTQTLQLATGDSLCLITDGITEAMNAAGEVYGVDQLEAVLRAAPAGVNPAELTAAILADVRQHVGDHEPSDDLTLLVLRWNGPD